jgi:hypothetical protein
MSIEINHTPERTIVVPATYELCLKLTQEQLDWFHSLCANISGNLPVDSTRMSRTSPLREITDDVYYKLMPYCKDKVNIRKVHWVGNPDDLED